MAARVACSVLAVFLIVQSCAALGQWKYPTVTPAPTSFTQGTASVLVTNPSGVPVSITHGMQAPASAAATAMVQQTCRRSMLNVMSGIGSNTKPWLKVRLPPHLNTSNPADFFAPSTGHLSMFKVTVADLTQDPDAATLYGIDESYTISIPAPTHAGAGITATITANSYVGVMHAMETMSQLIVWTGTTFMLPNLPLAITDAPRFKWRGLLVDTARHYFPIDTLQGIIDGLAALRMNTMHWHIVDSQSFPFQSTSHPELSAKGAFAPDMIYTHADITALIQYALARGVRIVPEFDVPGHTAAWGFGYPWLTSQCWPLVSGSGQLSFSINLISLNVADPRIEGFMDDLLKEISALFPDPYLHMGGDEVDTRCWGEDPAIQPYLQQHNLTLAEVQAYFTKHTVLPLAKKYGKRPVFWEEAFDSGSVKGDSKAVVDVWTTEANLPAIAAAGQEALISYGAYLDRQNPANGNHWMFFSTWQDMYTNMIPASVNTSNVIGGEASSWGENVEVPNVFNRVFQRLPAVAERLWSVNADSSPTYLYLQGVRDRMGELRCKLVRRGLRIGPAYPDVCDSMADSTPSAAAPAGNTALIVIVVLLAVIVVGLVAAIVYMRRNQSASRAHRGSLLHAEAEADAI